MNARVSQFVVLTFKAVIFRIAVGFNIGVAGDADHQNHMRFRIDCYKHIDVRTVCISKPAPGIGSVDHDGKRLFRDIRYRIRTGSGCRVIRIGVNDFRFIKEVGKFCQMSNVGFMNLVNRYSADFMVIKSIGKRPEVVKFCFLYSDIILFEIVNKVFDSGCIYILNNAEGFILQILFRFDLRIFQGVNLNHVSNLSGMTGCQQTKRVAGFDDIIGSQRAAGCHNNRQD